MGTLVHRWVETGKTDSESAADQRTLEKKIALSGIDREFFWPSEEGQHEVTFAIHVFLPIAPELHIYDGPRDGADEWKKQFEPLLYLTGTIDWLWNDGRIDDLKTGAWPVEPKGNKQLLSYCLVPWIQAGAPLVWSKRVSITQWPRYPITALPDRKYATVTGFDCAEHLEDIRWSLAHPFTVRVVPSCEVAEGKLHPCSGCEAREPFGPSQWMQSFWYRTYPSCARGLASIAKRN